MKLTFEKIDNCDLVIIDLTEKGVGLGIEADVPMQRKYFFTITLRI